MRIIGMALVLCLALGGCKKDAAPTTEDAALRAKTSEAIDNLDKLQKSAASYYTTPHVARETGSLVPPQFPASSDWSPAGNPCEMADKRFPATPDAWTGATWSALNFAMNAPHYYRYKVESSGEYAKAKTTITASADLDCDGKWSTYTVTLEGDESATRADAAVKAPQRSSKDDLE